MPKSRPIRIGMLGLGVVGSGAYRMLLDNRKAIEAKAGAEFEIVRFGVRNLGKERIAPSILATDDLWSIVNDPTIDVILELMGGVSPARELIEAALRQGKHIVTANKELVAKHGADLIRLAAQNGLDLHFEAAVGGGIPLIQPLKHQLAGNDVLKMMGILNGTTNYILTRMTEDGSAFDDALGEAQRQGYAEADPTADVDGLDAQYKLSILGSIAFGYEVSPEGIYREGIRGVSARDIEAADELGYRIKLLAIAESPSPGRVLARVHPTLLPKEHPLADVRDVYNAVWIKGDFVGDVMLSGRGAGGDPTGSSVVGDLIDVCRNIRLGGAGNIMPLGPKCEPVPVEEADSSYYLRMVVQDRPKALGRIATAFGNHNVSLAAMRMRVLSPGIGEIVFLTHECREASFLRALSTIRKVRIVESMRKWMRVEKLPG